MTSPDGRWYLTPILLTLQLFQTIALYDPLANVSTPFRESIRNKFADVQVNILTLDFQWEYMSTKMIGFEKLTGMKIIKRNTTQANWFDDIHEDVNGAGIIDLYAIFGNWIPTFVEEGGLHDITESISHQVGLDWFDIMPAVRSGVASYKEKIYALPMDGDVIVMLYRTDLVEGKGLPTPRTWNDVLEITKYYENKDFTGDGLPDYANCFSTAADDIAGTMFWSIASSFLQTQGTSQGAFFDPDTFDPMSSDPRFISVLEFYKKIVNESPYRDEGPTTWMTNLDIFEKGRCVLWYNYPGPTRILISNQEKNNMTGILNYASLPGMKCNDTIECPFMSEDNANHAPFLASGGVGFSVNSRSTPEKQEAALAFAYYISDPAVGYWDVAYPGSFLDPLRQRHTVALSNPESPESMTFLGFGWEERQLEMVKKVTEFNFLHDNYVKDLRILGANDYQEAGTMPHLLDYWSGKKTVEATADAITKSWNVITEKYGLREQRAMYRETLGLAPYTDRSENLINNIRPVGWALSVVILFASVFFSAWTERKKRERIVRASQPIFLEMICLGTFVMGSAIFPLGIDESIASQKGCDIACMSWPWLFFCGFTIVFSALFSKIWRINKIFGQKRFTRIKVSERDVAVPFLAMFSLNVILLLLWTTIDPLVWNRVFVDDLNSYGVCESKGRAWIAFIVLLGVVNFSALTLANIQAYRARAINDEFSESKYVAISMASILQMSIVGIPLLVLVRKQPPARFFVHTGIIFVICMSLLLLIFIPKMRYQVEIDTGLLAGQLSTGADGIRIKTSPQMLDAALREIKQLKCKVGTLRTRILEKQNFDIEPILKDLKLNYNNDSNHTPVTENTYNEQEQNIAREEPFDLKNKN